MESAQTGHVGRSLPRGICDTVDRTSASADIVASLCDVNPQGNNTTTCLKKSQHKCVGFAIFDGVRIFAMQRIVAQNCLNGGVVLPL
jgi:hypothetical protein